MAYALRRLNADLNERKIPLMGVLAAAIFAGQMLNFSVTGGTSGHLMGAAIATILLGPWAAVLVLTAVVSIQALIFQDGGILALGANIFNMAVVGVTVAYFTYRTVQRLARGPEVGRVSRAGLPPAGCRSSSRRWRGAAAGALRHLAGQPRRARPWARSMR